MTKIALRLVALVAVAAGLVPAGSGRAQTADEGFYLGLSAGYAMSEDIAVDAKFSTVGGGPDATGTIPGSGGFDLGMTAGYQYEFLRGEIDILGQLMSTDSIMIANNAGSRLLVEGDVSLWSIGGNLLVEAPIDSKVRPYVGGGAGFGSISHGENQDSALVWNGQGGIAWYVTDRAAIDAGYRYTQYGDMTATANSSSMASTFKGFAIHSGRVGFRILFGE